jgi:hypothetical protein
MGSSCTSNAPPASKGRASSTTELQYHKQLMSLGLSSRAVTGLHTKL